MSRRWTAALAVLALLTAGCTGAADEDGLDAEVEGNGWTVKVTYPNNTVREYVVTSDPQQTDTDGDGLDDFQELQRTSDPRNIDTDGDRLLDGPSQCPEAGSELADKVQERDILEHPTEDGCYVGEASWELDGVRIKTKPNDAHSDDSIRIGDNLTDSEEIVGWDVTAGGETYHVFSNPSTNSPDTDGDGLHDGLEKELATDPQKTDTDGDGVSDLQDAAPLGNLVVVAKLTRIDLKSDQKVTGGADLKMEVHVGSEQKTAGPKHMDTGTSRPGLQTTFDVPDRASSFDGGYGAGNWETDVHIGFWDDRSGEDEPIEVKSGGSQPHVLSMRYQAFEDTWTGDARGGTSEGADAKVTIDLSSRVET